VTLGLRALRLLTNQGHKVGEGVMAVFVVLCHRAGRAAVAGGGRSRRNDGRRCRPGAVVGGGRGQCRVLWRKACREKQSKVKSGLKQAKL
jgi:hypothetical protein